VWSSSCSDRAPARASWFQPPRAAILSELRRIPSRSGTRAGETRRRSFPKMRRFPEEPPTKMRPRSRTKPGTKQRPRRAPRTKKSQPNQTTKQSKNRTSTRTTHSSQAEGPLLIPLSPAHFRRDSFALVRRPPATAGGGCLPCFLPDPPQPSFLFTLLNLGTGGFFFFFFAEEGRSSLLLF